MLRPVVSLKTDVIVDGDGVIENSLRYYVGTELVYDGNDFQILTEENKDSGDHFFVIADDGLPQLFHALHIEFDLIDLFILIQGGFDDFVFG